MNITLEQSGSLLTFMIENTVNPAAKPSGGDSGIGLANIRRRLDILYPGKYKLHIEHDDKIYRSRLTIDTGK